MATRKAKRPKRDTKFRNSMYWRAYAYARDGMSDKQIAESLGVSGPTFARYQANDPDLEEAVQAGRTKDGMDAKTFGDYIYQQLSPELQDLWTEVEACAQLDDPERIEKLLANGGKGARQHLFIHSLATTCFNISKSMSLLNVSRKTYDNWRKFDPGFAELLDEMEFHKDNFFETAFMGRVQAGDTAAILHAVKSKLGHRGYNDKLQVEHTGTVNHQHTITLDLASADLSVGARRELLAAIRGQEAQLEKERTLALTPA